MSRQHHPGKVLAEEPIAVRRPTVTVIVLTNDITVIVLIGSNVGVKCGSRIVGQIALQRSVGLPERVQDQVAFLGGF